MGRAKPLLLDRFIVASHGVLSGDRTPILFRAEQIEELRKIKADMIPGSAVARATHIPLTTLEALADVGCIRRVDGAALALVVNQVQFYRSSVDAFLDALGKALRSEDGPSDRKKLGVAVRRMPVGAKPWLQIFRAILNGGLSIYGSSPIVRVLDEVWVSESEIRTRFGRHEQDCESGSPDDFCASQGYRTHIRESYPFRVIPIASIGSVLLRIS